MMHIILSLYESSLVIKCDGNYTKPMVLLIS